MSTELNCRRRVLFVDDDPQFLRHVTELMRTLSGGAWDIVTAGSAGEAFTVLRERTVHLAVVDVEMAVMDGIQLLALLHRGHPQIQKAVLTSMPSEERRTACLANGADLFLAKPTEEAAWLQVYLALTELLRFHSDQGFRGVMRRVGLDDVLQMECLARKSSVLEVADGSMRGEIFVEHGQIVHAQAGVLQGEQAFNRLLALRGGQFNLRSFAEPPSRTISGQWEFLLMEAARQRDEAIAAQPPPEVVAEAVSPVPSAQDKVETLLAIQEAGERPAPETTAAGERPRLLEMLVCSSSGDVLHEWQCRDRANWVSFFEFLSQKSQRLAQGLTLGDFDRLEIETPQARSVVLVTATSGTLVGVERSSQSPGLFSPAAPVQCAWELMANWMWQVPSVAGELCRALRGADAKFVSDQDSAEFPAAATAQALRCVADTWDVLLARRVRPELLLWRYRNAALYCVRRMDGTVFGVFVARRGGAEVPIAPLALLEQFRLLRPGSAEASAPAPGA